MCVFLLSYFMQRVFENTSTVKIPDEVSRESRELIESVWYTKELDKVFMKNFKQDQSIRYKTVK